jgi:paired small multidrug resistance pump
MKMSPGFFMLKLWIYQKEDFLKMKDKYWTVVLLAALFEVIWVTGLKHADQLWSWVITIIAIAVSFSGLIYASKHLPTSSVYAVFVGLGTVGTVLTEMIWFGVPFNWAKAALVTVLLVGVIGLKLRTTSKDEGNTSTGGQPI